jgi:phage terminase large subunit GpA-like protein
MKNSIHVNCPKCGHYQALDIINDDDATYSIFELQGRHTCDKCDSIIFVSIDVFIR